MNKQTMNDLRKNFPQMNFKELKEIGYPGEGIILAYGKDPGEIDGKPAVDFSGGEDYHDGIHKKLYNWITQQNLQIESNVIIR